VVFSGVMPCSYLTLSNSPETEVWRCQNE